MAGRPTKEGLDYFELDCHMDEKVKMIQAEFGLKGFAVVVKLYQLIYGQHGYYCEWNDDMLLLFMLENGVTSGDKNLIKEIVQSCIKRNLFSERIYKEYGVLTSVGVQKRYLNAVSRRESVNLKKEYLLLNDGKNSINVDKNSIYVDRNSINADRNAQSKEEKSKVEKRKEKERKEEKIPPKSPHYEQMFFEFWYYYPNHKRQHEAERAYCEAVQQGVRQEDLLKAAKRYKEECREKRTEEKYMMQAHNFINHMAFKDYLGGEDHSDSSTEFKDWGSAADYYKQFMGNGNG